MNRSLFTGAPERWPTAPLKHLTLLNPEVLPDTTPGDTELSYVDIAALEGGNASAALTPKQLTFDTAPSRARRVIRSGDTVLSTVRTYLKAVANFPEAQPGLIASTGFAVLRPNGRLHPRFAYWAALSEPFIENVVAHSEGVSYPAINPTVLGSLHMPVPSLTEQVRIANFLDDKTARIDALIAEKEQLLAALNELLSSEMEKAFTGAEVLGARRLTGNQFFPTLPEGWSGPAIKYFLAIPVSDGPHETPEFLPEGIPFVSAEAIKGGRVDFEKKRGYISEQLHKLYCQKVKPQRDDIFMVKSGNTTGAVGIVETDDEFSVWSPLAVLRSDESKVLPGFLYLALQSPYFQRSVQLYWSQGTQPNIGMAVLANLRVAVPPLPQQVEIIRTIGGLRCRTVALTEHTNAHIARLREYRSSLISAAVTGQLDLGSPEAAKA